MLVGIVCKLLIGNHRTQLCLYRDNESQPLVANQTYFIRCTVNNCSRWEHQIIFFHLSQHGYHLLESHTTAFPPESQLNVSRLKYRNNKCHRTMTFIATKALNGTTVQCKAIDYNTWTYSRATWIQRESQQCVHV